MNTHHYSRPKPLLRAPLMASLFAVIGLGPWFVVTRTAAANSPTTPIFQAANLKPGFGDRADYFGYAVAISGDTAVIGAYQEDSGATGINGDESDGSAPDSGAAYVFVREGTNWVQQAYLKASNTEARDFFGYAVAISGNTIVVGAFCESSSATGVNGDPNNNNAPCSGAAYVFVRQGTDWLQQAYLKASNTGGDDWFGLSVTISDNTIAVGAYAEDSNATGVNGGQGNDWAEDSGAAYVFVRSGTNWSQQAYLKASNTGGATGVDTGDWFGFPLAISGDTLVVGARYEDSNARGVDGDQNNENTTDSGAAYVFVRSGTNWSQQAYLKASNGQTCDEFANALDISGDTIVVGAWNESGNALGSGAAYVFVRRGTEWSQQAYLKASNPGVLDDFGTSVSVSGDTVVVGADGEDSNAIGVNGNEQDNSISGAGAAYVFQRDGTNWSQQAYLKPPRTNASREFGWSVAVAGATVVIGGFSGDLVGVANPIGEAHIFSGLGHGPRLDLFLEGPTGYRLGLEGAPEASYGLQRALNPAGPWETLATLITPTSGRLEYDDEAPPARQSFYRTVQP